MIDNSFVSQSVAGLVAAPVGLAILAEEMQGGVVGKLLENSPTAGALIVLVVIFLKFGKTALEGFQSTMKEFKTEIRDELKENTQSAKELRSELYELRMTVSSSSPTQCLNHQPLERKASNDS